eukprot:6490668-Amphidinium_carterae.8
MAGNGNGDITMINGHISEETMSVLQQTRLKASTRAVPSTMPTVEQTIPRPTATANPVSPPEERPTGHNGETGPTGPSSTTPMDIGDIAAATVDNVDITMRAESISCGSSSQATVSSETMINIKHAVDVGQVVPM